MRVKYALLTFVIFILCFENVFSNWEDVDKVLKNGIAEEITPGCAAIVGNKEFFGKFTYDEKSTSVSETSLYDLASVTKVLSTTTAIEQFIDRNELTLSTTIAQIFPKFGSKGKDQITVENCLLHNAGFRPDPVPWYWDKEFGCPETSKPQPQLAFTCQEKIKASWLDVDLIHPVGSTFVYSDFSMITLHFVVGKLSKDLGYVKESDLRSGCPKDSETCFYEAYVRKYVFDALELNDTGFLPSEVLRCVNAWNDTEYRHRLVKGFVSDGDSFANGGIAGHAGLFSTLKDVSTFMQEFLFHHKIVRSETIERFIKVANTSQSSRALGWDTNVFSNSSCAAFSPETFLHTGFTGTLVCADPKEKVFAVLLTNRCFPEKWEKRKEFVGLSQEFVKKVKENL